MEKSPDAFRTISELADLLETPAHVLRFWESRFPQIKPVKRAGGRRYYRPADVALIAGIRRLLHDEGLTIRGVQKMLREQGVRHVASFAAEGFLDPTAFDVPEPEAPPPAEVVPLAYWREQRREADPVSAPQAPAKPPQPTLFDMPAPQPATPLAAELGHPPAPQAPDQPGAEGSAPNTDAPSHTDLPPQPPAQAAPDLPPLPTLSESADQPIPPAAPWYPPLIRALPRDIHPARKAALAAIYQRLLGLRQRLEDSRSSGRR